MATNGIELWPKGPWTRTNDGTYVTEASDLLASTDLVLCPRCQGGILRKHKVSEDLNPDGEVMGERFIHSCGARLLIIND